MPFLALFMLVWGKSYALQLMGTAVLCLVIFPLLGSFIYFRTRGVKNLFKIERKLRFVPFCLSIAGILALAVVVHYFLDNILPVSYLIVLLLFVGIALGITLFWKISLHTMGIGGFWGLWVGLELQRSGSLFPLRSSELLPALPASLQGLPALLILSFLSVFIVGIARLILKAHSPAQVIAGALTGFATVAIYGFYNLSIV